MYSRTLESPLRLQLLCFLYNPYVETQSTNREDVYFNSVTHFIPTEPTNKIPSLQHFTLPQFKLSVVSDEYHKKKSNF